VLIDTLQPRFDVPFLDTNQAYAELAIAFEGARRSNAFKIGVVGGVGPAATVDFIDKVVKRTEATRDQEHIKMVVEQNPQIPDRTANLIGDGEDPTIPLYATCQRLEAADGADAIAIPCNTAHAFVERIQKHLSIPIINMLSETVAHIRSAYPDAMRVGLLATHGTVQSGVYQDIIEDVGLSLVTPDAPIQQLVMNAIYGEAGVKAGFTEGQCQEDLYTAIAHLRDKGAEAVILGCTELPLIAPTPEIAAREGFPILLDPTAILALKCVALARGRGARGFPLAPEEACA
jgi:aspartate racemase